MNGKSYVPMCIDRYNDIETEVDNNIYSEQMRVFGTDIT